MSPTAYTTIPLHTASTASTGLTFWYQRQCPHQHIPLFHCILRLLHTAPTEYCIHCINWFDLFAPRQCPHQHIPLFHCVLCLLHTASTEYCIHCVNWFDLFTPKTMSPPPYTTIPLRTASTASTGLTFWYQRQCPHHHIPLFYCVLCPQSTASTGLTFLHQRQSPHHHIPLFHCVLHTASTGLTFLHQRQCPHHHIPLFHCVLHPLHPLL